NGRAAASLPLPSLLSQPTTCSGHGERLSLLNTSAEWRGKRVIEKMGQDDQGPVRVFPNLNNEALTPDTKITTASDRLLRLP
ncbi:hypothetical protein KAR02_00935, partial [Candidatus Bipolaricaulota bacterium]|nr:hypothetical protein [Candidatus Bipolaricaulota bacterium]